jgi:hypothetical protein
MQARGTNRKRGRKGGASVFVVHISRGRMPSPPRNPLLPSTSPLSLPPNPHSSSTYGCHDRIASLHVHSTLSRGLDGRGTLWRTWMTAVWLQDKPQALAKATPKCPQPSVSPRTPQSPNLKQQLLEQDFNARDVRRTSAALRI